MRRLLIVAALCVAANLEARQRPSTPYCAGSCCGEGCAVESASPFTRLWRLWFGEFDPFNPC